VSDPAVLEAARAGALGLRLLVISLRWPPYAAGGYELLTEGLALGLARRGHAVYVLCGRGRRLAETLPGVGRPGGAPRILPWLAPDLDGGDLFRASYEASNAARFALHAFSWPNLRAARRALAVSCPDAVLYANLGLASLAPLVAARAAGVPALGWIADGWPLNHWLTAWRESASARAKPLRLALAERLWRGFRDLVRLEPLLAVSEHLRARLVADGLDGRSVGIARCALDPGLEELARSAAQPERAPGEALRVACTSSMWAGKGHAVLLEAAALAARAGAALELELAGGGDAELRARLEETARERGLAARFHGALERPALAALLARSHVHVLPSVWPEPFAVAPLEAMAHGRPVIVSDAGGSPELVPPGSAFGILTRAGDAAELARALARLAADEPARRAMGSAARTEASARYSSARLLGEIEARLVELARPGQLLPLASPFGGGRA
jgi:glycosyltransferase involved in cell wall biosynthesis